MRGLIIDTETTGLSHNYNQVLTVGMLHLDINLKKIKFFETDHIKIKHKTYNINKIAMQINKINLEEHNKTALETKDACKKINKFIIKNELQEIPLIGHNIGFDLRFLKELYRQNNEEFLFNMETIDTRDIWNNLKVKGIIPYSLKGSLKTVANHFNIDYSHAHDAVNDCKITAGVLQKMLFLYN
jgi:DNA polymerase III alpha subunit (gram-positive type)